MVDLKIENILISKSGNIKIIDFGLSNLYSTRSLLTTYCGSLYFAAPELLNAKAYTGPEVDIWSFGIVLYVLVCGKVPFDDQSMAALHAKIKRGIVEYPSWLSGGNPVSGIECLTFLECRNLLSRILVVDVSKRAAYSEIAQHPWMTKGGEGPIENYLPVRLPLTLPVDDEIIRGMSGFDFGTEDEIRSNLTAIIQSPAYAKASEQYLKLMETATSMAIAEKAEKRKPFSLEFYRRKSSNMSGSWPDIGVASASSLNFEDPTTAFHPLMSIYYLVQEKQERDRQQAETASKSSGGLTSPKTERNLRIPSIPIPEAAHTGDPSYEITNPAGKTTSRSPSTAFRGKSRGEDDFTEPLQPSGIAETSPLSPKPRLLEDLTGGKGGGLFRRISHKWSREPVKEVRKEPKMSQLAQSVPPTEIATPTKSLVGRKSREIDRLSFAGAFPGKVSRGLGRSTSISEADYRKRHAVASSDDESVMGRRNKEWSGGQLTTSPISPPKSLSSGRTRSVGHARHATISAARRAHDRQDRDFWSGPLSGTSTIPEESKPASGHLMDRPNTDQYARPVHIKSLFSVSTTSTKPVQKMRSDLVRVLDQLGISHEEIKGGFCCVHRPSIALESVQEPTSHAPTEEFYAAKKTRRRLSLSAPIAAAAAQLANLGSGEKRVRHETESDASGESVTDLHGTPREDVSGSVDARIVQFEVYIVKFPLLSLHGIQFKRVGGDVWQYKNACVKILGELNL
jgi:serine/threonine protein kinase KIN1/2